MQLFCNIWRRYPSVLLAAEIRSKIRSSFFFQMPLIRVESVSCLLLHFNRLRLRRRRRRPMGVLHPKLVARLLPISIGTLTGCFPLWVMGVSTLRLLGCLVQALCVCMRVWQYRYRMTRNMSTRLDSEREGREHFCLVIIVQIFFGWKKAILVARASTSSCRVW